MAILKNVKANIKRKKLAISWFFIYSTSLVALLAPYNINESTYETLFNLRLRVKDEVKDPMNTLINSSYIMFGLLFLIFIFQSLGGELDCSSEEVASEDKSTYVLGSVFKNDSKNESRIPVRLTFMLYVLIGTLALINVSILGTNRGEIETQGSDLFFGTPGGVCQVLLNLSLWPLIIYYFFARGIFQEFRYVVGVILGFFKACFSKVSPSNSKTLQRSQAPIY